MITGLNRGTRQWWWYTADSEEIEDRLNAALSDEVTFPIHLTTEPDPDWEFYTDLLRDTGLQPGHE